MKREHLGDITVGSDRRLLCAHVGSLVVTTAVVATLLLGIVSIPHWISLTSCFLIALVAVTFMVVAVAKSTGKVNVSVSKRIQAVLIPFGLAAVQLIFVVPVMICIYAPTFRS